MSIPHNKWLIISIQIWLILLVLSIVIGSEFLAGLGFGFVGAAFFGALLVDYNNV